jgi:hypothetical protein
VGFDPVPAGTVGKDCQRRLLRRPRFVRACSATDFKGKCKEGKVVGDHVFPMLSVGIVATTTRNSVAFFTLSGVESSSDGATLTWHRNGDVLPRRDMRGRDSEGETGITSKQ